MHSDRPDSLEYGRGVGTVAGHRPDYADPTAAEDDPPCASTIHRPDASDRLTFLERLGVRLDDAGRLGSWTSRPATSGPWGSPTAG